MSTQIILKEYECGQCGRYFYVHQHAGSILGIRCPFFCMGPKGIGIYRRIIKAWK